MIQKSHKQKDLEGQWGQNREKVLRPLRPLGSFRIRNKASGACVDQ